MILGPQAICDIDFTMSVLKVPTKDASANPGVQTAMYATVSATDLTTPSVGVTASAIGTRTTTVFVQSAPTVTTGLPTAVGTSTASLAGTVNPNGAGDRLHLRVRHEPGVRDRSRAGGSAGAGTNPVASRPT